MTPTRLAIDKTALFLEWLPPAQQNSGPIGLTMRVDC
jgi:hypothetical protein